VLFRSPERVNVHDFPDPKVGKAIPYGVYDLGHHAGWVGVGTDHDTAAFAVATLRRWWEEGGRATHPPPARRGCCSPPTPAAATATGSGRGSSSWPGLRPRRGWRSPSATCRQGPPSRTSTAGARHSRWATSRPPSCP